MPTLDDAPIVPALSTLAADDLVQVYDMSARRPKTITVGQFGTVRYDAAQTPLNSNQLAQFLDNLGRDTNTDVLDLGTTTVQAYEFIGSRLFDLSGATCDLSQGLLQDNNGLTIIDWINADLWSAQDTNPVASWGYDSLNSAAYFDVGTEYRVNGVSGHTGTHTVAVGDTIEITGGIITDYDPYTLA